MVLTRPREQSPTNRQGTFNIVPNLGFQLTSASDLSARKPKEPNDDSIPELTQKQKHQMEINLMNRVQWSIENMLPYNYRLNPGRKFADRAIQLVGQ